MILAAKNTIGAQPGDTVLVSLDKDVQIKGYFLSYLFPLFALIAGSTLGYVLGNYFALPSLDVFMGFAALSAMTAYTFLRLRRFDRSNKMTVKKILGLRLSAPR
jgi:positive regulator of sigma E activity